MGILPITYNQILLVISDYNQKNFQGLEEYPLPKSLIMIVLCITDL